MIFPTFKVANVSTAHITPADRELLMDEARAVTFTNDYGALVCVTHDDDIFTDESESWREEGFSDAFLSLMAAVREQGFDYIWFDSDGGDVDGAPTFDDESAAAAH
jgi:hypothetical protein